MRRVATAAVVVAGVFVVASLPGCRKRPEERIPEWIEQLKSPDAQASGNAARQLIDVGEPAVPALAELLKDGEPRVRRAAASTLWGLGRRMGPAVPALAETLRDPDPEVRLSAAMALESAGEHAGAAVPALVAALKDPEANVRLYACKALGAAGPSARSAIPALVEAAKIDFLRGSAEEALRRIRTGA
ncbi:MAG TPA: HEAT repeat domain-containing protein [Vicinamibacteria bacterium]|jgi:HEAT repeat protein